MNEDSNKSQTTHQSQNSTKAKHNIAHSTTQLSEHLQLRNRSNAEEKTIQGNASKSGHPKKKMPHDLNVIRPSQRNFGKKQTVVIVGDSIVKDLIGGNMGKDDANHFYVVKSFSGATLKGMKDFIKPLTRRKPDKLILHVGTNDLKRNPPSEIAESMVDLATNATNRNS